jgi:uncharacterized protein YlxW (UPF0749 family)
MPDPAGPTTAVADRESDGWARLRVAFTHRPGRGQWLVAVLCALLGFGIATQVRTVGGDDALESSRPEDLVRVLDSLDQRRDRLDAELLDLERTKDRLLSARDQERAADEERQQRLLELGVLAGTIPARGPGIVMTFSGPVPSTLLLDTVQELRDAGAEAMQIDEVRIVASTSFVDGSRPGTVVVDGETLTEPMVLSAIGDPAILASALRIPGGILDTAAAADVQVDVASPDTVVIDAVVEPADR